MTLNEFASEAYCPHDTYEHFFDSLDSGQNTHLVGCRQSGKSTALAVYMAYHLITNTQENAKTIMFSTFNSSGGKILLDLVRTFVKEYNLRHGGMPWDKDEKLRVVMANGNKVEYFDSKRLQEFRGKNNVRAILLDEFGTMWDALTIYGTLRYNAEILDAQLVIVGKRPKVVPDSTFNFYSIQWFECGLTKTNLKGVPMMFPDTVFHSTYERMTPYLG